MPRGVDLPGALLYKELMNNAEQVANAVANFFSVRGFESRRFGESVDVFGEKGDFEVEVDEEFASVEGTVECFGE